MSKGTAVKWEISAIDLWLCVNENSLAENLKEQKMFWNLTREFVTNNHYMLCLEFQAKIIITRELRSLSNLQQNSRIKLVIS
jgi:hypothetical protein